MKILVNIRKPGSRLVKDSYFLSFILCIMGFGFIYFSQSNFDEHKINEALVSSSEVILNAKSNMVKAFNPHESKERLRPQRRPFSKRISYNGK